MSKMPDQKPGLSRQDYCTPPELLEAIKRRLHIDKFAWDLAADQTNKVADGCYTEEDDALVQSWDIVIGAWNWLNPPYADIEPWVAKAVAEAHNGAQIIMLLPASVGSNWYREWVEPYAYVSFLNGRLCFIPDWKEQGFKSKPLYPKDCMICFYTPWGFTGSEVWRWDKG